MLPRTLWEEQRAFRSWAVLAEHRRMDNGKDVVSKVELAARLDASLVLPGSELLEERGYDEGDGWGFDGIMQTPMVTRRYATEASPDVVKDWFGSQLTANGWRRTLTRSKLDIYERGTEKFTLRLWGKPKRLSPTGGPPEETDDRFWYEVYLEEVTSSP